MERIIRDGDNILLEYVDENGDVKIEVLDKEE